MSARASVVTRFRSFCWRECRRFPLVVLGFVLGLALLAFAASGPVAHAAPAGRSVADSGLVRCYDRALGTVTLTANCRGEVVGAAQAAEIEQRRQEEVRRAVQAKPLAIPGRRLRALGSAFVVAADGTAITNNHVIAGCAGLTARGPEGGAVAKLITTDPALDLALVATHLPMRAVASFRAAGTLPAGSFAGAVGYPDLGRPTVVALLTPGRVMGLISHVGSNPHPRLVFRADVRHGDSGGPVLDGSGAVIGVTQAEVDTPRVYRRHHLVVADVGLAVPETVVLGFLKRNHVDFHIAPARAGGDVDPLPPAELLSQARRYVLQIGCWK